MSLNDHPKAYGTAALTLAFFAGVLVTLGFKDLYPELVVERGKFEGLAGGEDDDLFGEVAVIGVV
jgi:hypothetical protein